MRRSFLICIAALLAAVGAPGSARAAVPVLVVNGRGFGHGVGMAQDGAYWMGRAGASTNQILGHFYPGTALAKSTGSVRVAVLTTPGREAIVAFPNGGEVRDARSGQQSAGFPVRVAPGGQIRIRFDGAQYSAVALSGGTAGDRSVPSEASPAAQPPATAVPLGTVAPAQQEPPATTTTTALLGITTTTEPPDLATTSTSTPAPPTTQPAPAPDTAATSGRPLWAVSSGDGTVAVPARGRRYRGVIEAIGGDGLRLVNDLDVEQYLRGMGEVRNPGWPAASLRAQAVAARTYALRAMQTSGELCDTQRCQVYLGADAEYAAMNKAVADSARQVITYGRSLASAVYSANGGGFSASREEGFGTTGAGYPYLRPAPYETKDPLPWEVKVAFSDLGPRFGYPGQVTAVRVSKAGPSGRALEVTLDGSAGPRVVAGLAFDAGLGLKSTLFSLGVGTADVAPPPPTAAENLQALPEELAAQVGVGGARPPDLSALGARPGTAGTLPGADDGGPGLALGTAAVLLNASAAAAAGDRLRRRRRI
jgi:stage II sporulation protein D